MRRVAVVLSLLKVALSLCIALACARAYAGQPEVSFGPFVPTPMPVVEEMLKLANVTKDDIVYDLGCGDGRIVIMAAKKFGAKGVGIDIDAGLIEKCKESAKAEGVADRVHFIAEDAMKSNISDATVVTLYVLPNAMLKLRPKLLRELKPGVRIVSHNYSMGDWEADKVVHVNVDYQRTLYYWVVPAGVAGVWRWKTRVDGKAVECVMRLKQEFQKVSGVLEVGGLEGKITDIKLVGNELSLSAVAPIGGKEVNLSFNGTVSDDSIKGTQTVDGVQSSWSASRKRVNIDGRWKWEAKTPDGELRGELLVRRGEGGKLSFIFLSGDSKTELWDWYVWGASLRFSTKLSDKEVTFRGFVEDDKIVGNVKCDAWGGEGEWTAIKVGSK